MVMMLMHDAVNPGNWLAGEHMTRYLAAPLLLGTVSPRRVWHAAKQDDTGFLSFRSSPLRRLVEGQEWHRRLAARNRQVEAAAYPSSTTSSTSSTSVGKTVYKYWRYHGFLCRYAVTDLMATSDNPASSSSQQQPEKEGVLLVHGFGASGAQWNKALQALAQQPETTAQQGLAPDLLGFGQSEKPAVSYSGYLWDAQMLDFCKEIAVHRHGWTSYVVGGNSIGGYTSMSLAACDTATGAEVTSSGAPGTNRCTGLVLMNSAGPVKTRDEIAREQEKGLQAETIAQATAMDGLPACKPPPRPVGRVFGNVLLAYLRPRIQSICKLFLASYRRCCCVCIVAVDVVLVTFCSIMLTDFSSADKLPILIAVVSELHFTRCQPLSHESCCGRP